MVVDDIFNAGKGDAKNELKLIENIQEGIKYGALDENIVAAELSAVLRSIRKGGVRDADELTSLLERKGLLNVVGQKASRCTLVVTTYGSGMHIIGINHS